MANTALCIISMLLSVAASTTTKPNIVFILADDFGYNDIGYHALNHHSDMKTPFLDRLAADGIKLENYYVQPICTPTRSQLMSGRYQIHTGLQHSYIHPDQANALPLDNIIMPEQLRQCGYDTHMIGKWHLGDYKIDYVPWKRGFNSYYGFLTGSEDYYTKAFCWGNDGCGVDFWSNSGPTNKTWGQYSAHLYAERAKEVIHSRDKTKPLFLYMAFQSVHSPMQAPDQYVKPFDHIKDNARRIYGGMVAALDEAVENITKQLDAEGLLDDTIIVFSTDNGGQTLAGGNNWPLRGRKVTLWEGGVKGVGFLHGKPLGVHGVTHNQLLHVSDWLPTLLAATQCPAVNGTQNFDGMNQWKAILQEEPSPRTEILHNIDPRYDRNKDQLSSEESEKFNTSKGHAAIRSGPWKLLTGDPGFDKWVKPPEWVQTLSNTTDYAREDHTVAKTIQLYHIETDPYEEFELSDKFPTVVEDLLAKLAAYNKTAVPVSFPPTDPRSFPKNLGGFWGPWL
uniref:arylsulfatase I-like n=1 Tax=Styela clava TaxID=7725 RepID=UPI00193A11EC|nr:arylsulfatase I-like [Styela clava]